MLPVMVSIGGRYFIKHGLMSGATVGTFSYLGFLALAIGGFALARRMRNLSLKLTKVGTLKDKICIAFFFVKGCIGPWLHDLRDCIPDLQWNFARCLEEGNIEYAYYKSLGYHYLFRFESGESLHI